MTEEIKEEIKEQLKLLFLQLHPKGITEFTIEYNGSGDDFNDMWVMDNIKLEEDTYQTCQDIVWKIIEDCDVSFCDEGGGGEILFDLKNLRIEYNSYYNERVRHHTTIDEINLIEN